MEKFDIKHPLRGPQFEHEQVFDQKFREKIVHVVGDVNSYLNYKKDRRQTMDQSELRSDAYIKQELDRDYMLRTILKYRLFGRDGVTAHELQKLKNEWKVIPKKDDYMYYNPVSNHRRKKRIKKTRINPKTKI